MKKFSQILFRSLVMGALIFFTSCHKSQNSNNESPKIIFDTDMGSDCDDAGALALLHAYADSGKAELIGCIYSSGAVPYGAGIIEAINIYYGRPAIPIGANHEEEVGDPVDKMQTEKLAKDTAAFKNTIINNRDAGEQTRVNRRLLAAAEDTSIIYLTVGHTKGLYDLLVSEPDDISPLNGYELTAQKIKKWVAMGAVGAKEDYSKDWNLFRNGTARYSKYLTENFPRPVYFSPSGAKVMSGSSLKNSPPGNIVRTAYRDWLWGIGKRTLDDQRSSWDLIAVYYAVEGLGDFLEIDGKGRLQVDVERGCKWHEEEGSIDQTYVVQKEETDESFAAYLNEMIGRPPKHYEPKKY